jgi:hypothetical protein
LTTGEIWPIDKWAVILYYINTIKTRKEGIGMKKLIVVVMLTALVCTPIAYAAEKGLVKVGKDAVSTVADTAKSSVTGTANIAETTVTNTPETAKTAIEAVQDTANTALSGTDETVKTITGENK